jgi:hypothetical protein
LIADIIIKYSSRGGRKVDIYRSKKGSIDFFYGITNPKMFDDALTTKEKLNLDYFLLFFSENKLLVHNFSNGTNGQNKK